LLVRQVTEVRADLFALLAEAEEVLLDDVLVGGTLLARDGLPDQPLLERQVPERRPRVRRREEEDLGLEVDLLAELDRLAHRVGGLAGRGDHERAVGVAEHALGLLDRDLHLLQRLPALVDGLEDLGARRLDAVAGLAHPDLVALLEHVRPALAPGAQDVVGDDVGAARAAPHALEACPPPASRCGGQWRRPTGFSLYTSSSGHRERSGHGSASSPCSREGTDVRRPLLRTVHSPRRIASRYAVPFTPSIEAPRSSRCSTSEKVTSPSSCTTTSTGRRLTMNSGI